MNSVTPLPLITFMKIAYQSGGLGTKGIKNIPPWILKTVVLEPLRWLEIMKTREVHEHEITNHPIFVLGFYRSGTTYLQQFLLQDNRMGFHTLFQMIFPEVMLTTEKWMSPMMQGISNLFGARDKVHRIPLNWQFMGEEDGTMTTALEPFGAQWGFFFPRKMMDYFDRYVLFEGITEDERAQWRDSYLFLLKKVSIASNSKRLVLKSPPNTARIPLLKEMFPNAKFVFIHRNPFEVFESNKRFWEVAQSIYTVGKVSKVDIESIILDTYAKTMDKYLEDRETLSPNELVEISYQDFTQKPVENMEKIYNQLQLEDFSYCKKQMLRFEASQKSFHQLRHEISDESRAKVSQNWERYVKTWGYSTY